MLADRYYYMQLSDREKDAYKVIYDGVLKLEKRITFRGVFKQDSMDRIFNAITDDNPFMYYLNQTACQFQWNQFQMSISPQYFCTREQIDTYNSRIERIVNQMMSDLCLSGASEYEKVLKVHDYFCQNITYDDNALVSTKANTLIAAHSIIGVFAHRKAVCEGISKAFKLVMNTAGIKCIVVNGRADNVKDGHSWNIVKIDGRPYHIDVTWDLCQSKDGFIGHDYCNLSDEDIMKDHHDFVGLPTCSFTTENYYVKNNLDFNNLKQLQKYLKEELANGKMQFCFRYKGPEGIKQQMPKLVEFVLKELPHKGLQARAISTMNENQGTGKIEVKWVI